MKYKQTKIPPDHKSEPKCIIFWIILLGLLIFSVTMGLFLLLLTWIGI